MAGTLVVRVTVTVAVLGALAMSSCFVLALYLWKLAGYKDANRDDTGTIQRRSLSALLTCICSASLVFALAQRVPEGSRYGLSYPELLGFQLNELPTACLHCLSLTAILFVGPIVQHQLAVQKGNAWLVSLPGGPWVCIRNLCLAPFTEEFVFRASLVRLWVGAGIPWCLIILFSPLCFSLAHTHHFVEQLRKTRNWRTALVNVAFQVFYTSLFGMFSNFLLLRTGCTPAVILSHSFCNHQGFPDLMFFSKRHHLYEYRICIGALYVIGIVSFVFCLAPLTEGFHSNYREKR